MIAPARNLGQGETGGALLELETQRGCRLMLPKFTERPTVSTPS